jgi:phytoene synthase
MDRSRLGQTYCARVARRHARTFWLASLLLPAEKRRGAFALYAFCRVADDIVDDPGAPGDVRARLARHGDALERALRGEGGGPLFDELSWACRRFAVPAEPLKELLRGVARDLNAPRYETWEELERYCEGVASSVGEMCVSVFGLVDEARRDEAVAQARALGTAMQLTNILRDVGEDARRGRCYLPREDLAAAGLEAEAVLNGRVDTRDRAWRRLIAGHVARAREYYRRAIDGIPLLAPDAQACARACAVGYAGILDAIERQGYDTLSTRARLGWAARLAVLWGAVRGWARPASLDHEPPTTEGEAVRLADRPVAEHLAS